MLKVSVVIPTYNSSNYLVDAVSSVLAQSFQAIEVLVIDDGSIDDTAQQLRQFGEAVRYIHQTNSGVAQARNRGIQESRGRYVAFLDADDIWLSHKLARQLEALRENPTCRAGYSAVITVNDSLNHTGEIRNPRYGSALEDLLLRGNVIGTPSSVICERALLAEMGGFDPQLSQCADWDLWVRLAMTTEFHYIDEPLIKYRQHDNNMSRNAALLESDSVIVLEKGFALPQLPTSLLAQRQRALARNYMVLAGTYFHAHRYRDFVRCAARAVAMDFGQARYLAAFPRRKAARLKPGMLTSAT